VQAFFILIKLHTDGLRSKNWLQKATADRLVVMASFASEIEIQTALANFELALKKRAGQTPSNEDAAKLYRLAADGGFAGAQNNLGDLYEADEGFGKNEKFAIYWYARSAEKGEHTAYLSPASLLPKGTTEPAILIESMKFAILAYTTLPEGRNRSNAQEIIVKLGSKLSALEKDRAFELANHWIPVFHEEHLMSDTPKKKNFSRYK
jgi:TPR repeat protein